MTQQLASGTIPHQLNLLILPWIYRLIFLSRTEQVSGNGSTFSPPEYLSLHGLRFRDDNGDGHRHMNEA